MDTDLASKGPKLGPSTKTVDVIPPTKDLTLGGSYFPYCLPIGEAFSCDLLYTIYVVSPLWFSLALFSI